MGEWQFWEDGIIGILCIFMGISFLFLFPKKHEKEENDKPKVKKKNRIFIIGGIVFILYGILLLIGYLSA